SPEAAAARPRGPEPLLATARMERERAAAAGIGRRHLVAVGGEHPRGRAVDLAEDDRLDAACEQPDAGQALAGGRGLGRRRPVLAPAGGPALERPGAG